ncbi:MAG: DUF2490 domain-containing protein [Psychroflexus salarius]
MLRSLFVFIFIVACNSADAQTKSVEHQDLLWTRYLVNFELDKNWTPFFDIEERMYMFPFRQHQFLPSFGVNYQLNNDFSLTAALLYFEMLTPQDPKATTKAIQREWRPQLALNYKHQISSTPFTFLSRFKSEWRFKKRSTENDYRYRLLRLRMRMGLSYQINAKYTATVLEEILINVGDQVAYNVYDQNRLSAEIAYKISPKFKFITGYMYWFQQRASGIDFFSRDIIYFTLKHNLKLY